MANIAQGSPAAQAGLTRGDVIIAMDNTPLQDESTLEQIVNRHKPGDTLALQVVRGTNTQTVQVKLGQAPAP